MAQKSDQSMQELEAKIVEKPAFTVTGMIMRTKPGDPSMMQLWMDFDGQVERIRNRVEPGVFYGVAHNYDWDTGEFDYLAALQVPAGQAAPEGMVAWEIPAQTYAVFETTLPQIKAAFDYIYGPWIAGADVERADGPEFEYYGAEFSPQNPSSMMSIWIPVREK